MPALGFGKSGEKLLELLRSRYAVIYVQTYEDYRVREVLEAYVHEVPKLQFFHWTCTRGLLDADNEVVADKMIAPAAILRHILDYDGQAVFMVRDMHPFLEMPGVRRLLRDASEELVDSSRHRYVVLVGPATPIPMDLEKDVIILDYALPTKEELAADVELIREEIAADETRDLPPPPTESDDIADRAAGMTLRELSASLALSLTRTADRDFDLDTILEEKQRVITGTQGLEYVAVPDDLAEVGGQECLHHWLHLRWPAFVDPAAWDYGLPKPKGILLIGPPGTGKSLRCKDMARQYQIPLIRMNLQSIFGRYVGQSEGRMEAALKIVKVIAPCILWIDEIEKGVAGSKSSGQTDSGVTARVFGSLLTWMQEKREAVFVAATANNVSALPPELLRKGRFDEIFYIELPTEVERKLIFDIHLRSRGRNPEEFNLDAMAEATDQFSGSEIEHCVIEALYEAYPNEEDINTEYVLGAIRSMVPLSKTMAEQIKELRAWAKSRARMASAGGLTPRKRIPRRQAVRRRPVNGKGERANA